MLYLVVSEVIHPFIENVNIVIMIQVKKLASFQNFFFQLEWRLIPLPSQSKWRLLRLFLFILSLCIVAICWSFLPPKDCRLGRRLQFLVSGFGDFPWHKKKIKIVPTVTQPSLIRPLFCMQHLTTNGLITLILCATQTWILGLNKLAFAELRLIHLNSYDFSCSCDQSFHYENMLFYGYPILHYFYFLFSFVSLCFLLSLVLCWHAY